MAFVNITSPHAHGGNTTSRIMLWVILATVPGIIALTYFFGWGNLINIALASVTALTCEAIILAIRKRPISFFLKDNSALLTAVLLGIALPPFAPWWVTVVAVTSAIIFAKHLYGGLGNNPFNPAMVGYALVLVSFPVAMTVNWATPLSLLDSAPSITQTLSTIWGGQILPDAFTGATPLDLYKHEIAHSLSEEVLSNPIFGAGFSLGWEWVNAAFLLGGLVLLWLKVIPWQTPVGVLTGLAIPSILIGYDADQSASLMIHLLSGATMLGAFFIATDPITSATTNRGRLIFGVGIGLLTYIVRVYGSYPDAFAFAVLLMNFAAPLIDVYTQPRTYGYEKAKRGPKSKEGS